MKVKDEKLKDWKAKMKEIDPEMSDEDVKKLKDRYKNKDVDIAVQRIKNVRKPFAPASEAVTKCGYFLSAVDQRDKKTRELNGTISLFIMEDEEGSRSLGKIVNYGSDLPFQFGKKYEISGREFEWAMSMREFKELEGTISEKDIIAVMKDHSTPIRKVKQGESGIVCVAMSADIKKIPSEFKNKGTGDDPEFEVANEYPFFTKRSDEPVEDAKNAPNVGLACDVNCVDEEDDWLTARFSPQAFGKLNLVGILDEDDEDDISQCEDESQGELLKEMIPSKENPTYIYGFMKKVKERGERVYRTFRGSFAIRDMDQRWDDVVRTSPSVREDETLDDVDPELDSEPEDTELPVAEEDGAEEETLEPVSSDEMEKEVTKWLGFNPKATVASIMRATEAKKKGWTEAEMTKVFDRVKKDLEKYKKKHGE